MGGNLQRIPIEQIGDVVGVASDINNKAVVVGTLRMRFGGGTRAFTWSQHTGLIVMEPPDPFIASAGEAINEAGRVFGLVAETDDYFTEPIYGTFWNPDGGIESVAATASFDMVARGALNSRSWTIRSGTKLWIDQHGPIDLPGLVGDRYAGALGLNNRGNIVGSSPNSDGIGILTVWTVHPRNVR